MRMTYNKIKTNLESWNISHPEMTVCVTSDIAGVMIRRNDTQQALIFGETPGKCWDQWCIFAQAYKIGWRMANLGKGVK